MNCPECGSATEVLSTRSTKLGLTRRRKCFNNHKFTTKEEIMGKPKRIDRPVDKTISLSQELVTRTDLELFSDLEQKVPFGAWSKLITGLLTNWLIECRQPNQPKELSND